MNLDGVEAEEEVLAEAPGGDLLLQVRVRRREQSHVRAPRLRRADALELSGLKDAQEFRLEVDGHVRYLVEEERSAVGQLEATDAVGLRVGERASDVAKQLRLESPFGERARVDSHHRLRGARRERVERARDDLLAGAVLAGDEDGRVRRADVAREFQDRLHRG